MRPPDTDCADIRELLPEYALGILGTEEAVPVRMHLECCGACRTEHEELADVVALLARLRDALAPLVTDDAPTPLLSCTRSAHDRHPHRRHRGRRSARPRSSGNGQH
ncbi:zf-HC2 domain-containing protein [Streptomyces sp. NPDC006251]|uniref:anti-sigma factor family protein n=1 Tax=Streptomyces sp. NPDC006251 TaxID=3155718 RepID=UPI0033A68414